MRASMNLTSGKTYFTVVKQKTSGTGFFDDACKDFYLRRLLLCQNAFQVEVHAYLLLREELFLLFTPLTPSGFESFIRFLNKSYTKYYFTRFTRKASPWQNKPTISRLPTDKLILDCQKFMERYVIDSGQRDHPGEYRFSSYCANAFSVRPNSLKRHRVVSRFINLEDNGLQRYRDFMALPFNTEYRRFLQSRLFSGEPLLHQKAIFRLENRGPLTDIKKNGKMVAIEQ